MSTHIEARLRASYIANGGSETVFETIKSDLVADYRRQATIADALAEANRPASMNDLIRLELQQAGSRNDDTLQRTFQKGTGNDDAA